MIDRHLIEIMLALEETGNFSRAAEKLYISQPSLSRTVLNLEEELGVKLFNRKLNPIKPTYYGRKYIDACRQALLLNNSLEAEIKDSQSGNRGHLTLGISRFFSRNISHVIVSNFSVAHPNVELSLVERNASELENLLAFGEIDVALVYSHPGNPHLEYDDIFTDDVYLAVPPSYAAQYGLRYGVNDHSVDLVSLEQFPFILLKKGHGLRTYAENLFEVNHIIPKIRFETDEFDVSSNMVKANLGYAFATKISVYNQMDTIYCCNIKDAPSYRTISICTNKDVYHLKAEEDLITITKRAFAEMMDIQ